ncbi:MAG: GNAT family N-acetyltransferase [Phycisphaerales bacterium]
MSDDFPLQLAAHLDRVRRHTTPFKPGVITLDVPGGWISARPGAPVGDFPSASMQRVYWLTQTQPLTAAQVAAAGRELRQLGCEKAYVWLAPWAWSPQIETTLNEHGVTRWPFVEYIALARPAAEPSPPYSCSYPVRQIAPGEAAQVLAQVTSWYGADSAAAAQALLQANAEELFAAFQGDSAVAVGLLALDGPFGYLSAASTSPDHRARGAQTALIAARIERARAAGCVWCTVETNSTVAISLRNLERAGFRRSIVWRVYVWDLRARPT